MKHRIRRGHGIRTFFIILAVIIAMVAVIGKGSFSFAGYHADDRDYSDVIRKGVGGGNPRIVDMAMLGAHDAFSSRISASSEIDPAEDEGSIVRNKTVSLLANGLIIRLSKAQLGDAAEMATNGVRYFDVRLSNINGEWHTKHALVSDTLSYCLTGLIRFLNDNPGEFIVFDMQHVYLGDSSYDELFGYLSAFKADGHCLLDYVNFDPSSIDLGDLGYNDVTVNGTRAGVVILAKTPPTPALRYHYERGSGDPGDSVAIRSVWHNTSSTEKMLAGIRAEYESLIGDSSQKDMFRVNQAQKTGVYEGSDIVSTLAGWSLVDLANRFNPVLVSQGDFESWLNVMPIFMVDNATSSHEQFNQRANDAMIAHNRKPAHAD
jgi:hypothetical protein